MTEPTLAWLRTTERPEEQPRAPLLKSRIGRRVVGLFILSALVPLGLCAAFLLREFSAELTRTQQHNLDGLVRSFGMTLVGRLGSADDVLKVIVSAPGATDDAVQENVAKLLWVRSIRRVNAWQPLHETEQLVPSPDARQQRALNAGEPVLLWGLDVEGNPQVHLVRKLPSGAWLYVEITAAWLWADASEFTSDAGLLVLDDKGRTIASGGTVPGELLHSDLSAWATSQKAPVGPTTGSSPALRERWMIRSWEVFLGSRFSSPSWRVVMISPRLSLLTSSNDSNLYLFGIILLTILLITWLSMTTIRRQLRPLGLLTQATKRVAQRDFDGFEEMSWNDEFGDLARSFSAMSGKLKMQFSALETLSEVDRLLLHTPELELILDTLLPRMAGVLHCDGVSVLLFDPDSDEHARAYDYYVSQTEQLPVRRIATDIAALRTACEQPSLPLIDAAAAVQLSYLAPIAPQGIKAIRLHALKHDGRCAGVLCIGYASDTVGLQDAGVGAADFADRLSLILANLKQSESLHRQANFDSLTGLQNRHLFSDRIRAAIAAAEERQELGGLLYLDLDHFKHVNDTAGHTAGDGLLRIVGERLVECVGEGQSIGRLGGDEFAVLLPSIAGPDSARQIAEGIIASLQRPIVVDGREYLISASIGMTVFPSDGSKPEELLRASDIAMYQAKDAGRGRAVFFQAEMQRKLVERLKLESGMHRALQRHDFTLHYQPIVDEAAGGALGVEALVRWPGGDQAPWVPPAVFVPVAEENGLIVKLGDWILRSACEQFARWRSEGLRLDYVSVNVSVRQLREPDFVAKLIAALKDSGMQGKDLQVEITESVLAHGAELERTLGNITAQGVRLALDDFGTGYSSLSYLRAYPIHTVKIDRSFVQGLPRDPAACRLAESIIVMCAVLGKNVVAEGVETEAQQQFLRRAGCTAIQGYLLGRPMEAADIPGFARRLRSTARTATPEYLIATSPHTAKIA
jgi:diguanylate cyclase (GGDEF)-like protein